MSCEAQDNSERYKLCRGPLCLGQAGLGVWALTSDRHDGDSLTRLAGTRERPSCLDRLSVVVNSQSTDKHPPVRAPDANALSRSKREASSKTTQTPGLMMARSHALGNWQPRIRQTCSQDGKAWPAAKRCQPKEPGKQGAAPDGGVTRQLAANASWVEKRRQARHSNHQAQKSVWASDGYCLVKTPLCLPSSQLDAGTNSPAPTDINNNVP
ncbi:hypothetical protein B0T21DRAFT_351122 [Apiosordaria backusii]|uniref:Uncharacterized protein n=1 Tax=Apiosordaria backusii TaxID=314023 RepID=A0AA40AXV1_9PEZI|nr:hypothetical protein B0T21DRAFT_351122 [Apiosordaria backusii]